MKMTGQKRKNWQWRIIIWASFILIFGKDISIWAYRSLGIETAYNTTTTLASKTGLNQMLYGNKPVATAPSQLVIEVKNDTPNDYTIESKIAKGQVDFDGLTFAAGETKRFTIRPENYSEIRTGLGDILFLSGPINGSNSSTTCQEIHTLNYDLKYANQIRQPLSINLSAISSKMDCRQNGETVTQEVDN